LFFPGQGPVRSRCLVVTTVDVDPKHRGHIGDNVRITSARIQSVPGSVQCCNDAKS
jgi:hypothetical protein